MPEIGWVWDVRFAKDAQPQVTYSISISFKSSFQPLVAAISDDVDSGMRKIHSADKDGIPLPIVPLKNLFLSNLAKNDARAVVIHNQGKN